MTNYQAIKNLNEEDLEELFNQIYLTGVNIGANNIGQIQTDNDFDVPENLYNQEWLQEDSEPFFQNPKEYMTRILAETILRIADIDVSSDEQKN